MKAKGTGWRACIACAAMLVHAAAAAEPGHVVRSAGDTRIAHAAEFAGDLRALPAAPVWRPGEPIKEIPRRSSMMFPIGLAPVQPLFVHEDPLLAAQTEASSSAPGTLSAPLLNFDGQGYTGVNPADPVGDVGVAYYIQAINSASGARIQVYDKSGGSAVGSAFLLENLGTGACASGFGDPVVLYDQLARRWLLSEFSAAADALCVYVSKTADPIGGGWWAYQFSTPNFPDYPKYSVWPGAYFVTSNEPGDPPIYALDRDRMLAGLPSVYQRFTAPPLAGFGFQALTPGDLDGAVEPPAGAPAYFVRHRDDEAHNPSSNDPAHDFIEVWELAVDFTTPASSTLSGPTNVRIAEIDSDLCGYYVYHCFAQPGSSQTLDPLREVVMWRSVYRNFGAYEVLLGNLVTDVDGNDHGGIRWYELRRTASEPWTLYQEGTWSPDEHDRFMGSTAMDGAGNVALAYSITSESVHPGIRYAGRRAGDTPGVLTQGETVAVAGASANASNRWGDYSSLNLDPVDDCTFWMTGMYAPASSWSTRITSFRFADCGADSDGDGVGDALDNCTQVANADQCDSDGDGFGNRCDPDLNNNGVVNFADVAVMRAAFNSSASSENWNADADLNCNGTVNFTDLGIMRAMFGAPPGPSSQATP